MSRLLATLALLLIASASDAATYYVAKTGSLGGTGTIGNPFLLIAQAVNIMGGGDTVYIRAGTYAEAISTDVYTITGGTSEGTRATISNYNGEPVTIQPTSGQHVVQIASGTAKYIDFRGLDFDGTNVSLQAVKITWTSNETTGASHHIRIFDSEVHGAASNGILTAGTSSGNNKFYRVHVHHNGGHGIYLSNDNNLVSDCEVDHQAVSYGVHIYNGGAPDADANIVEYTRAHDNGDVNGAGILLASGTGNIARYNQSWNNDYGIKVFDDAVDSVLQYNWNWSNDIAPIIVNAGANGTVQTGNFTIMPGNYGVGNVAATGRSGNVALSR